MRTPVARTARALPLVIGLVVGCLAHGLTTKAGPFEYCDITSIGPSCPTSCGGGSDAAPCPPGQICYPTKPGVWHVCVPFAWRDCYETPWCPGRCSGVPHDYCQCVMTGEGCL